MVEAGRADLSHAMLAVIRARLDIGGGSRADYEFNKLRGLLAALPDVCPNCIHPLPTSLGGVQEVTCGACRHHWSVRGQLQPFPASPAPQGAREE